MDHLLCVLDCANYYEPETVVASGHEPRKFLFFPKDGSIRGGVIVIVIVIVLSSFRQQLYKLMEFGSSAPFGPLQAESLGPYFSV